MDVRIGVTYSPKELVLELPDDTDRAALKTYLDGALEDDDKVLWLTDKKGREIAVPSSKVAYVELGATAESRRIGFGSS